jgi:thiol:disulfide interchange protein/DsbC/DsbD-like thiol-disulfide interchange protein
MPAIYRERFLSAVLALVLVALGTHRATAQFQDILGGKGLSPGGDQAGALGGPESIVSVFAQFTGPDGDRPGMLSVTARIEPPWYTYSTTQKPLGATPTRITVDSSEDFRLAGEFRPTLPPKIVNDGEFTFEEFAPEVTWQAPLEFRDGVTLNDLKIKGSARIQVCKVGSCLAPTGFEFEAAYLDTSGAPKSQGEYKHPNVHATLSGYLEPRAVTPGATANLVVTAEMPAGWHIYEWAARDPGDLGYKPTLIALANTSGFRLKRTTASDQASEAPSLVPGLPAPRFYEGRVTWTTPIVIPIDTQPGQYPIEGFIGYQTCFEDARCDLPRGAAFSGTLEVRPTGVAGAAALAFRDAKYGEAVQVAASQGEPIDGQTDIRSAAASPIGWTLPIVILAGLAGGFILNFMPCVLPVIGLKILSFAEQAGRSRAQILALNVWYALGTFMVFFALATLATSVSLGLGDDNLGWGEQFKYTSFNIVMVAIVFVMALSFLGVWEIPIPGFVGTGKATELAAREGAMGAFSKGVLATVLATPCSGPALGPVFGFTIGQPAWITYLLFGCIALGMSAPYLLIGAFPTLIRFLPKPGAWMDTFKNLMGFVLLGTVAFLFSFMDRDYLVPTFTMMVGLWAACWWIGRTPLTENLGRKLLAWGQGAAFAAVVCLFAFTWLVPRDSIIPWQPFSRAELARLRESGNTVLVDFTADWCLTCKYNLLLAIETQEVRDAIAAHNIVPLLADYTKGSPEIKDTLESLRSKSIPLLAIFPAGDPEAPPIVLRDVITKQQLLNAIEEAGSSKGAAKLTAAVP